MRRIFVGDIQGCLEPLERLLEAVAFEAGEDLLLPTGDLVNKGPDSHGVLRRLIELDAQPVLGNHDLYWLQHGLVEDLELERWLRSQPIARVFDDIIMIHAGLHPRWSVDDLSDLQGADRDFAVTVRYCDAEGNQPDSDWPPPEAPYLPWDAHYRGERRVVFGHWARRGLDVTGKVVALDSGCVYGKELSAYIAEEDRIVQVDGWRPDSPI